MGGLFLRCGAFGRMRPALAHARADAGQTNACACNTRQLANPKKRACADHCASLYPRSYRFSHPARNRHARPGPHAVPRRANAHRHPQNRADLERWRPAHGQRFGGHIRDFVGHGRPRLGHVARCSRGG